MSTPPTTQHNTFLEGPLPALFVRTTAPIVLIMAMNGLQTVIDVYFLGEFVGAFALSAVTLMFPVYMLLVALATLVAGGMASVLARRLGAADFDGARAAFLGAHTLALLVCAALIAGFALGGSVLADWLANGSAELARDGYRYISILIWFSPVMFVLSINSDALRCEGRMGLMAAVSLVTSSANIVFNYLLIVVFDYGVAGSAAGTVAAMMMAFAAVLVFRLGAATPLKLSLLKAETWRHGWSEFLALGTPQSLTFLGISLGSGATIAMIQAWGGDGYAETVAAYGIATRVLTFTYLPLLGLSMALQTIAGNNFGAGLWHRSDASLRLAVLVAFVFCAGVQLTLVLARHTIGTIFVDDPVTVAELARILPIITAAYFIAGPLMILAGYFQAIGDATRTAVLNLSRTYLFAIPLTLALPPLLGEPGIWLGAPLSELLALSLAVMVLAHRQATTGRRWGVFHQQA